MFKYLTISVLFIVLIYTRFVNLSWGLPYPFHPDERNMAVAMQQFTCGQAQADSTPSFLSCLNPKFFAYGQFPLYISYFGIQAIHRIKALPSSISFEEAIMSLRIVSAMSSVLTVMFLWLIVRNLVGHLKINSHTKVYSMIFPTSILIFIFSPVFIQFAHFGTTESLLIFYYVMLIYFSLQVLENFDRLPKYITISGVICGMAIGTKVSAAVYAALPVYILLHDRFTLRSLLTRITSRVVLASRFVMTIMFIALICSPYNLLALNEFLGSFQYESGVALGNMNVFYTRQFQQTVPVIFQFKNIFPYVLGPGVLFLFISGFFFLPWKNKYINLLRLSFILAFLPNAFMYAKWTRFIAPAYPVMLIMAVLFLFFLVNPIMEWLRSAHSVFRYKNISVPYVLFLVLFICFIVVSLIPGAAYLSIYRNTDIRFIASKWIYENMPQNSYILSETANVIDMPIPSPEQLKEPIHLELPHYQYISFNFYDLDTEPPLQMDFENHMKKAEYIFIPSRRLFMNHTCITVQNMQFKIPRYMDKSCAYRMQTYPLLNDYYMNLFAGKSGFKKVAEFSSYPRLEFFGTTIWEFPDENAEETWTVFDHPVIRIYKRDEATSPI